MTMIDSLRKLQTYKFSAESNELMVMRDDVEALITTSVDYKTEPMALLDDASTLEAVANALMNQQGAHEHKALGYAQAAINAIKQLSLGGKL